MDFDEYEYLEKAVEDHIPQNLKDVANGGNGIMKSGEKDRNDSYRQRDEGDYHVGKISKRSRSGDGSGDHDGHREKGRSRSRGVRNEKGGERHRSNREHGDREGEREKRKGKNQEQVRHRDRNRDKVREHEHDSERKEHNRDGEILRDRHERYRHSRSHSNKHRDERESNLEREPRERNKDRECRERSPDREMPEQESRRHKEKKEEAAEPDVDPERDQRTVFAYQLPLRADEKDIFEFFSRAGRVRDVRLIMDRSSRRSKGVGYIEFYDVMSVPMAIALSGQPMRGQPVMVKPSEAEKNLVQSVTTSGTGAGGLTTLGAARRLYVGNLVPNISEDQLRAVFESFGTIELVQLPRDEAGLCKGFAFVQFTSHEDAKAAQNLNEQLDIGGRLIKVSAFTDQPGMQDARAITGDLDDDEGGGMALNASSRALLMQKLDRSGAASSNCGGISAASAALLGAAAGVPSSVSPLEGLHTAGLSVPPVSTPLIDTIGVPSECLLLKNMFDPKLEAEPDYHLDIKDDVQDECAKFGTLKHLFVDKNSDGFVYLRFGNTQAAMNAQRALHGRWFAGKMITATFMLPQNYEARFPEGR